MRIKVLAKFLPSRSRRAEVSTIVLHATAGSSLSGALSALWARELSYHYLIEKSGAITKAVPYTREAWHAGKSFGPEGEGVNRYSVGISFVNRNDGKDPYTQEQIEACRELVGTLKAALPIKWITTHYAISPGRKTDPKGFPVSQVDNGLTRWNTRL